MPWLLSTSLASPWSTIGTSTVIEALRSMRRKSTCSTVRRTGSRWSVFTMVRS